MRPPLGHWATVGLCGWVEPSSLESSRAQREREKRERERERERDTHRGHTCKKREREREREKIQTNKKTSDIDSTN